MTEYTKAQINRMAEVMNEMLLEEDAELARYYEQKTGKDVAQMPKQIKEDLVGEVVAILSMIDDAKKNGKRHTTISNSNMVSTFRKWVRDGKAFTQNNINKLQSIYESMEQKKSTVGTVKVGDIPKLKKESVTGTPQESEPMSFEETSKMLGVGLSKAYKHTFNLEKPTKLEIQRIENGYIITVGDQIHCMGIWEDVGEISHYVRGQH